MCLCLSALARLWQQPEWLSIYCFLGGTSCTRGMHQFPQSQELLPQHGLSKTGFAMLFPVPASLTHLIVDVYNRCCIKIGFNNLLSLDSFVKYFRLSYLLPIFTFLPIPWTSSTTPSSSFVADSLPNLCFAGFFPRTLIALHDTRLPTENGIIVGDAQN